MTKIKQPSPNVDVCVPVVTQINSCSLNGYSSACLSIGDFRLLNGKHVQAGNKNFVISTLKTFDEIILLERS